jgi:hypothetical protein
MLIPDTIWCGSVLGDSLQRTDRRAAPCMPEAPISLYRRTRERLRLLLV